MNAATERQLKVTAALMLLPSARSNIYVLLNRDRAPLVWRHL